MKTIPWIMLALMIAACAPGKPDELSEPKLPAPVLPENGETIAKLKTDIARQRAKLDHDPFDHVTTCALAGSYHTLGRVTGNEDNYRAEVRILEAMHASKPHNAEITGRLAGAVMSFHQFHRALELSNEAINAAPDETWMLAIRGDSYMGLGEYEKARTDFEALVTAKPVFAAKARLASTLVVFGDIDAAFAMYREVAQDAKSYGGEQAAWAQLMLGVQYLKQEQWFEARREFGESLRIAPDYYLAMEHITETFEAEGKDAEARPYLETAIAVHRAPELLERLATIEARSGNEKLAGQLRREALEATRAAAERSDGHIRALAEALLDRGIELEEALALAQRDLEIRRDLHACRVMARALRLNGRASEAVAYVKEMLRYGSHDIDLREEGIAVYEAAGLDREASALRTRVSLAKRA